MSNRTLLARARELAHKSPTLSSSQAHAAVVHVIVRDQSPPNCEYHALLSLLFDIEHFVAKNGPNLAALVALQYLINAEVDDPRGPPKRIVAWAVEGGIIIAY